MAASKSASKRNGRPAPAPAAVSAPDGGAPLWLQLTTIVLALAGLGVSIYVTYEHFFQKVFQGCSSTGLVDCQKVTTSAQSYVPIMSSGILHLPVAVLGLGFFLFAGVPLMSPWAWQSGRKLIHQARLLSVLIGMCFVLYLIYAEFIIIGNICLFCTSVHVITFLLFVLTIGAYAMWGLRPGRRFARPAR